MQEFLQQQGAPPQLISRVAELIAYHEVGGDAEQNVLKDADSISFLEIQAEHFLTSKLADTSWEEVRDKIKWMFDRISSPVAKELAQGFYDQAIERLEELKPA